MKTIYERASETAKKIRTLLKETYPELSAKHFKVTSETYSGGSSISVHYNDFPNYEEVNNLLRPFSSNSFDGSIDLETHEGYNYNGIHYSGAGYVFVTRDISEQRDEAINLILTNIIEKEHNGDLKDYNEKSRLFHKIDSELTSDLLYLGNPRDLEGLKDNKQILANTKGFSKITKDFVQNIYNEVVEEQLNQISVNISDEGYKKMEKDLDQSFKDLLKDLNYDETFSVENLAEIKENFSDKLTKIFHFKYGATAISFTPNLLTNENEFLVNKLFNTAQDVFIAYKNQGFSFKVADLVYFKEPSALFSGNNPIIQNLKQIANLDATVDGENILTSLAEREHYIGDVTSFIEEATKGYLNNLIDNDRVRIALTKKEQIVFEGVISTYTRGLSTPTPDDLKEILNKVLAIKKEEKLTFSTNLKNSLLEVSRDYLENTNANLYDSDDLAKLDSIFTPEFISSQFEEAQDGTGLVLDKSSYDISIIAQKKSKYDWAKKYRPDVDIAVTLAEQKDYIVKSAIQEAVVDIKIDGYVKDLLLFSIKNIIEPHIGKGLSVDNEDEFLAKYEGILSKHNHSLRVFDILERKETNYWAREVEETIKDILKFDELDSIDHYNINIEGKYDYKNVADSIELNNKYENQLFRKISAYLKENGLQTESNYDFYTDYRKTDIITEFKLDLDLVYKGELDKESFIQKYDEILENPLEVNSIANLVQSLSTSDSSEVVKRNERAIRENIVSVLTNCLNRGFDINISSRTLVEKYIEENGSNPVENDLQDIQNFVHREAVSSRKYTITLPENEVDYVVEIFKDLVNSNEGNDSLKAMLSNLETVNEIENHIRFVYKDNAKDLNHYKHLGDTVEETKVNLKRYVEARYEEVINSLAKHLNITENTVNTDKALKLSNIIQEQFDTVKNFYEQNQGIKGTDHDLSEFITEMFPETQKTYLNFLESDSNNTIHQKTAIMLALQEDVNNLRPFRYYVTETEVNALAKSILDNGIKMMEADKVERLAEFLNGSYIPYDVLFPKIRDNMNYLERRTNTLLDLDTLNEQVSAFKGLIGIARRLDFKDIGVVGNEDFENELVGKIEELLYPRLKTTNKVIKLDVLSEIASSNLTEEFTELKTKYNEIANIVQADLETSVDGVLPFATHLAYDKVFKTVRKFTKGLATNILANKPELANIKEIKKANKVKFDEYSSTILDIIRKLLKETNYSYRGQLTINNLLDKSPKLEEYFTEFETLLADVSQEVIVKDEVAKIVPELKQILADISLLDTDITSGEFVIYKNGFAPEEYSILAKAIKNLYKVDLNLKDELKSEVVIESLDKEVIVTPKHLLLGLKLIKGSLGYNVIKNTVNETLTSVKFNKYTVALKFRNKELIVEMLNSLVDEIGTNIDLYNELNTKLPFQEKTTQNATMSAQIYTELVEDTLDMLADKKGILLNPEDEIFTKAEHKEYIIGFIDTELSSYGVNVTQTNKENIKRKVRNNLINLIGNAQATPEYADSFKYTYNEREVKEITQRLRGTMSKMSDENKLTKSFKDFAVETFVNNNFKTSYHKDVTKTYSDNLIDNNSKEASIDFINEAMAMFEELNGIAKVFEISPMTGKSKVEGMSKRQLQVIISNTVTDFVSKFENENVKFEDIDKNTIFGHILNKTELVNICDRVNMRIFNNKVNKNPQDISMLLEQEVNQTLGQFEESDEFKTLLADVSNSETTVNSNEILFEGNDVSTLANDLIQSDYVKVELNDGSATSKVIVVTRNVDAITDDFISEHLDKLNKTSNVKNEFSNGFIAVYDYANKELKYIKLRDVKSYSIQSYADTGDMVETEDIPVANGNSDEIEDVVSRLSPEVMIKFLRDGIARITFTKKTTGEKRVMWATRNSDFIEKYAEKHNIALNSKGLSEIANNEKLASQIHGDYIKVFSIDSKGFRTFKPSSLYITDTDENVAGFILYPIEEVAWELVMQAQEPASNYYTTGNIIADSSPKNLEYIKTIEVDEDDITDEEIYFDEDFSDDDFEEYEDELSNEDFQSQVEHNREIEHRRSESNYSEPQYTEYGKLIGIGLLGNLELDGFVNNKIKKEVVRYVEDNLVSKTETDDSLIVALSKDTTPNLDVFETNYSEYENLYGTLSSGLITTLTEIYAPNEEVRTKNVTKVSERITAHLILAMLSDLNLNNVDKEITDTIYSELYPLVLAPFNSDKELKLKAILIIGMASTSNNEKATALYSKTYNEFLTQLANKLEELKLQIKNAVKESKEESTQNTVTPEQETSPRPSNGFVPSDTDVTYKNINLNELIYLIQNNIVTVTFRKTPTKKLPEGELRVLRGTRNLAIIENHFTTYGEEFETELKEPLVQSNSDEAVQIELGSGTINIFDLEKSQGRKFVVGRLISYQVEGQEVVTVEDVPTNYDTTKHFNPKGSNPLSVEYMYETLRNKVVRVTFKSGNKPERTMWATANSELMKNYLVRDVEKVKYDPNKPVKTPEENKAEQLEAGMFRVIDLEVRDFRSFKHETVLEFNELHKTSSWIEFDIDDMGWFDAMTGKIQVSDVEDLGKPTAKPTTKTLSKERISVEAENRANYDLFETAYNRLVEEARINSNNLQIVKDKYKVDFDRLERTLVLVKEAEEKARLGEAVPKYSKADIEIKNQQEKLINFLMNTINTPNDNTNLKLKAFIQPKAETDFTTVLVIEYSVTVKGIQYTGLESLVVNPKFILNGVSFDVGIDTTNTFHFGTGTNKKSVVTEFINSQMTKLVSTVPSNRVSLVELSKRMTEQDVKRLQRLGTIVINTKDVLRQNNIIATVYNATPKSPAHVKFYTTEGNSTTVWQVTPVYIYNATLDKMVFIRNSPATTTKDFENYFTTVIKFLLRKPAKAELDKFLQGSGLGLSNPTKVTEIYKAIGKAFNLRSKI